MLWFKDGDKRVNRIADDLSQLGLKKKLRVLYSTACYGKTHNDSFLRGGFRVASGAVGVNANAAVEYPLFIANWLADKRFKSAIQATLPALTALQDRIARIKFPETNSVKAIDGRPYTRISTPAD